MSQIARYNRLGFGTGIHRLFQPTFRTLKCHTTCVRGMGNLGPLLTNAPVEIGGYGDW